MIRRNLTIGLAAFIAWGLLAGPALAYPTNTNITYNADVTPDNQLILYLAGEWGNDKFDDGHYVGFSYGLMDIIEIGGTWRLTEDEDYRRDPVFDVKLRYDLGGTECDEGCDETEEEGCDGSRIDTTGIAIGVDNINFDEDKNGHIIPYIAYTHDFDGMRATAGYSFEEDNGAIFVGFDAAAGDAVLKWDWTQIDDGDDWMAAVGFDLPFVLTDDNWCFSSYLAFSSNDAYSDVWGAEISYTFDVE
jgi:hypothetical protein